MNNDSMLEMFIYENNQLTERLEEVLIEGERNHELEESHINEVFRIMHTIKGSAAMMGYGSIAELGHAVEDMFFYIREHEDAAPDWQTIVDLCLESLDFFRAETAKIQAGGTPDGDNSPLLHRIHAYMEILTGNGETAAPEAEAAAAASAPSFAPDASGGSYVKLRIFFDEGSKMENVRAYQIALSLSEICEELRSEPAELLDDCAEEIARNGVIFYLRTLVGADTIREKISESIYVDKYELSSEDGFTPDSDGESPKEAPSAPEAEASSGEAEREPRPDAAPRPAEAPKEAPSLETEALAPTGSAAKTAPAKAGGASKAPEGAAKSSYISVSVDKLDKLMDLVGELVTSVLMVTQNPDLKDIPLPNFEKAAAQLRKNTDEMQEIIMSVRMIPVASTFHKMQRIVRDVTRTVNKEVELEILGEETEVDKNIIDHLSDPLMHIIRNSLDHGIEDSKDARIALGKSGVGKIVLEARNAGGEVIISITDDGRGFDKSRILEKALRQGIITNAADLSDREIFGLTLLPGFSTKEQVTELSGRGVGMDVVRRNIEEVGGSITLDSVTGEGSTVTINIPLTLAILNGMAIRVGTNMYILPILNIRESFKPMPEDIIVDPEGEEMIMVRGEVYPIVRLHRLFGVYGAAERLEDGIIIMGEDNGRTIGIFADELIGEQQVVVKPIPAFIQKRIGSIRGISGATILGNGCICLIVDAKAILDMK